jgi:hypothetical protein
MRFELICEDYYPEEHDLHCPGQLYEAGEIMIVFSKGDREFYGLERKSGKWPGVVSVGLDRAANAVQVAHLLGLEPHEPQEYKTEEGELLAELRLALGTA